MIPPTRVGRFGILQEEVKTGDTSQKLVFLFLYIAGNIGRDNTGIKKIIKAR